MKIVKYSMYICRSYTLLIYCTVLFIEKYTLHLHYYTAHIHTTVYMMSKLEKPY
jgi:hypothetical protein